MPDLSPRSVYRTPMGAWAAQQQKSGHWVVVYRFELPNPGAETFAAEARKLAERLSTICHPSLARLHQFDETKQFTWVLPGNSSLAPLAALQLPIEDDCLGMLLPKLLAGLAPLHNAGTGAFDFSPSLIYFHKNSGQVTLLPTPTLARRVDCDAPNLASMNFLAPELDLTQEKPPDPLRTDLYWIGALTWHLLTRLHRERSSNLLPGDHDPQLARWDAFVDGCCRLHPERRFPSLQEALRALPGSQGRILQFK